MDATVTLLDGMAFRADAPSGHSVILDASPGVGGQERGLRPLEMLLLGLGGCTGMDVISILRKMRQDVTGYEVRLHAGQAEEHPKVLTDIEVEHVVRGRGVSEESVRRAVDLSATRYCPASAMLSRSTSVRHAYRVVDEASGTEVVGILSD